MTYKNTLSIGVCIIIVLLCYAPADAHYSIIPEKGWRAKGPKKIKAKDLTQLARAESEHFIIYTTLDKEAALRMCKHLEKWHQQVKKLFPNFDEVEELNSESNGKYPHHEGLKVAMKVFAYPEEKGDFYGREPMHGNSTGGVVCQESKNRKGFRYLKVTALQHEITHFWRWRYFTKNRSASMSEGLADFLGLWDIDKSKKENLRGMVNEPAFKVATITRVGASNSRSKQYWMTAMEFFSSQRPEGRRVYQQGWWFYRFLFNSKFGRKYGKLILSAYRSDALAENYMATSTRRNLIKPEFRLGTAKIKSRGSKILNVPFTDKFVAMIDREWKKFVKKECRRLKGRRRRTSR